MSNPVNTSFLNVLENHKRILFKIANLYCKDAEDRKDLIQEITYQLWKSFDKYNHNFKYSTWIYRISLNVAISFYRKETSRKANTQLVKDNILIYSDDSFSSEKDRQVEALYKFISELKDIDKALILLYLEEKSHKEIAEIMGITETNVATKVSRIKDKLKQQFNNLNNQ